MSDRWELTPLGRFLVKSLPVLTLGALYGWFGYTAYDRGGTIGFVVYQAAVMALIAVIAILHRPRSLADTPVWVWFGAFPFAPFLTREMLGWSFARSMLVWVIASAVYIAVVLVGRRIFSSDDA